MFRSLGRERARTGWMVKASGRARMAATAKRVSTAKRHFKPWPTPGGTRVGGAAKHTGNNAAEEPEYEDAWWIQRGGTHGRTKRSYSDRKYSQRERQLARRDCKDATWSLKRLD